jgi:uracil-DNA glycosylase
VSRLQQPLASLLDAPHGDWQPLLDDWRQSAAGRGLMAAVDSRVAAGAAVYPAEAFRALAATPLARTQVVILGQDPYHGPGQAEGLAFSVPAGQRIPPSLRNIFKELQRDLGQPAPASGSLAAWAARGVLLLNTSLTVEDGQAGSHARLGWSSLTDAVCRALWSDAAPKVFMLWGAHAQARQAVMHAATGGHGARHCILQSNHPSPLSALRPPQPFIGCGHFRMACEFLNASGRPGMDWGLTAPKAVV